MQTSKKGHHANPPIAEGWIAGGFEYGNGEESELQTLLLAFLRRHAALPKRTLASGASGGSLFRGSSPTRAAAADREGEEEAAGAGCELGKIQKQAQVEMESQLLYLQEAARVKRLKASAELPRSGTLLYTHPRPPYAFTNPRPDAVKCA